jgi:hypothetical protein
VKTAAVVTTVGDVLGRRDRLAVPGLALSVFERGEAINWCDGITSIADPRRSRRTREAERSLSLSTLVSRARDVPRLGGDADAVRIAGDTRG